MTDEVPELSYIFCQATQEQAPRRLAYWEWGNIKATKLLICVHGLARQGRDFDRLARAMSSEYHVICPDLAGRGKSGWLPHASGYNPFTYLQDLRQLSEHLQDKLGRPGPLQVDWIGTSLGGLLGMVIASMPAGPSGFCVEKLVLNDVGPRLSMVAVERIQSYLGRAPHFQNEEEALIYLQEISAGFGKHSSADWKELCRPMLKLTEDGAFTLHYDPAIAEPFKELTETSLVTAETGLWFSYDQIKAHTLLLRGASSDMLESHVAQDMARRGPQARLVEIAETGHAPTLTSPHQISLVRQFLLA